MEPLRGLLLRLALGSALLLIAVLSLFDWVETRWLPGLDSVDLRSLHLLRGAITATLLTSFSVLLLLRWNQQQRVRLEATVAARTQELHDAKAFTDSILASTLDSIVVWDARGVVTFWSHAAERMFGHDFRDVIGRGVGHLLADARRADAWARGGMERDLGRILRLTGRRQDGTTFPCDMLANREASGNGEVVVAVFRDVTHQVAAEMARRRSESLRAMIDQLPDAVMVHRDEQLLYANHCLARMLGYERPADLVGRRLEELIHPEELGRVRARLRELQATSKPTTRADERFVHRSGETVVLEVAKVPIVFDGRSAIAAIGRDAAERDLAEERFRAAVASSPSGMVMVDPAGTIRLVNRAVEELFGYEEAELLGQPVEMLVPGRFRAAYSEARPTFHEQPRKQSMGEGRELFGLRKDGTEVPIEVGLNPITTREGTFVLSSVVDISERRRRDTLVAIADRLTAVGTLAAGVAHGINNPLAFVKGNLIYAREEMAEFAGRDCAEIEQALLEAEEGADRIRDLVADLLTFARKPDAEPATVDIEPILTSVINMTRNEIRHRARVVTKIGAMPAVAGNPSRLAHALTNIVINAAQAIPDGSAEEHAIGLRAYTDADGWAVIVVRDSGGGILPEHLDRIFEPFFTTKAIGSGTGLGLCVSHGIVSAMGGAIAVRSQPGAGTEVTVRLPPGVTDASATQSPRAQREPERLRILAVDDEALVLDMIERLLSGRHEVVCHTSARDAKAMLVSGERFDVILCDLMMPDMKGEQLFESIRRIDPHQAQRVVFLTGGAFTRDADEFLERVTNPRVYKPIDRASLASAFAELRKAGPPAASGVRAPEDDHPARSRRPTPRPARP